MCVTINYNLRLHNIRKELLASRIIIPDFYRMKLQPDYELVRSSQMSRVPLPWMNSYVNFLRRAMATDPIPNFQKHSKGIINVAFAVKGPTLNCKINQIQCYSCKNFGHYASQCKQIFCNFCKKSSHIIADCIRRP